MICEEMLQTAIDMVKINSVNSTPGEREIGIFLEQYLRKIPYFEAHPEQVIVRELKQDPLHRRNVMAIFIGEKSFSPRTLLFHGHTDTVGIEDYGSLKPHACNPEELMEALKTVELTEEVQADLQSGDYLFGRGICDMKSGDAVFLGLLKEICANPQAYVGNLVVSFNPVEENLHTGIIERLDILEELKERYHLEYTLAINNDFICPLYPGDTVKTIYTGTVGKILPCFYIQGKDTHVGQCFEGFDASMAAAKLVNAINLNPAFSVVWEGEYAYPPSVLKMKDLKSWYNVQTASEAFVYFNYFVHNAAMEEITGKLVNSAQKVMAEMVETINAASKKFCEQSDQLHRNYEYNCRVLTYEELYRLVEEKDKILSSEIAEILEQEKETDKREIPISIIRHLLHRAGITSPTIVLYYAAPYCPHNTLQGADSHIIRDLKEIVGHASEKTGETYRFMKFFPSLSDSSYLKIDDSEESLQTLIRNFPEMEHLYPIPLRQIRRLNIPAVNFGCYGKDAHKWTERVHIPYTFGSLPVLLRETIDFYLKGDAE